MFSKIFFLNHREEEFNKVHDFKDFNPVFSEVDENITSHKVLKAITMLQRNKATGEDNILKESVQGIFYLAIIHSYLAKL
jgi:hypothetical protein